MNKWIWYGLGAIAVIIVGRITYKEYLMRQINKEAGLDRDQLKKLKISELRAMLNDLTLGQTEDQTARLY